MMFDLRDLSVHTYSNGVTLWSYKGRSLTRADVLAPGFFAPASDMLDRGDMILLSAADGGAILYVGDGLNVTEMVRSR